MVADSLAAAVAAAEAAAGKPSVGYLKNHPMVAARLGLFLFCDLIGKIPVQFPGYCYYSKLLWICQ